MKNITVFITIITIFLSSCQWNTKEHYCIDRPTMTSILTDIHISDGVLALDEIPECIDTVRPENYYNNILKKYHINRVLFDSALSQYSHNEALLLDIYSDVIDNLSTQELFLKKKINTKKQAKTKGSLKQSENFTYSYHQDFENKFDVDYSHLTTQNIQQGSLGYTSKGKKNNIPVTTIVEPALKMCEFHLKALIRFDQLPKEYPFVTFEIRKDSQILNDYQYSLKKLKTKANKWAFLDIKTTLNIKEYTEGVQLYCCIVDTNKINFYIDDYKLYIKQKQ